MRNYRGEIATLLTLGLVLVGAVITLAFSFLTNQQKNLASAPKAAENNCVYTTIKECQNAIKIGECPPENLGNNCIICKNGKYRCPGTKDDSSSTLTPTKTPIPTRNPTTPISNRTSSSQSSDKCGIGSKYTCPNPPSDKCKTKGLEFECCVKKTGAFYGCIGTPCSVVKGAELISCSEYKAPTPVKYNITPNPSDAQNLGYKKCGSGYRYVCSPEDGYEPSCVAKNKGDTALAFRCCVFRSNGEIVDFGCVGTPCSAYGKDYIRPCSSYYGYQSSGSGSFATKVSPTSTPLTTPTRIPTPTLIPCGPKFAACSQGLVCDKSQGIYGYGVCVKPSPTQSPIPTLTLTPTITPTPPLLSETGVWAQPGKLYIENITNKTTIRLIAISLGTNYEQILQSIKPRNYYEYDFSNKCNFFQRRLNGHLAYYSSEDNYKFAKFKELNLSCDSYYVIGLD